MFFKHLSPALAATVVVLILCLTPGHTLPKVGLINFDKIVHAGLFGALAWLYGRGLFAQTAFRNLRSYAIAGAFLLSTLYGGLIEILQAHLNINRSGDWLDFLFDALGALLAAGLMHRYRRTLPAFKNS